LAPTTLPDNKDKTAGSSSSVSESGRHAEIGETDALLMHNPQVTAL